MQTTLESDFKALEAMRSANQKDFNYPMNSRVTISMNLFTYLEAVLKERVELGIKEKEVDQ